METKKKASIYTKLLEFQKAGISIKKDSNNPHFKSKYADIDEVLEKVKPALSAVSIVLTQIPDANGLKTVLYDTESDTSIESYLEFSQKGDPQKLGSNITYYRRYALVAMLGLEADDDDANAAVAKAAPAKPTQAAPKPAAPARKPAEPAMTVEAAIELIAKTTSLDDLKKTFKGLPNNLWKDPEVEAMKDQRKTELTNSAT